MIRYAVILAASHRRQNGFAASANACERLMPISRNAWSSSSSSKRRSRHRADAARSHAINPVLETICRLRRIARPTGTATPN